jgi:hypothetical protein
MAKKEGGRVRKRARKRATVNNPIIEKGQKKGAEKGVKRARKRATVNGPVRTVL